MLYSGAMPVEQRRVLGCVTDAEEDSGGDADTMRMSPAVTCEAGALVFTYFLDPKVGKAVLEAWERKLLDAVQFIRNGGGGRINMDMAKDNAEVIAIGALSAAAQAVADAGVVVEANTEISTTLEVEAQERADLALLVGCYAMMAFAVALLLSPRLTLTLTSTCSLCCTLPAQLFARVLPGVVGRDVTPGRGQIGVLLLTSTPHARKAACPSAETTEKMRE